MKIFKYDIEAWNDFLLDDKRDLSIDGKKKFFSMKKILLSKNFENVSPEFVTLANNVDLKLYKIWNTYLKVNPFYGWILTSLGILFEIIFLFILELFYKNKSDIFLPFLILFFIAFLQSAILHVPAHYLVAKIYGIKILSIFIAPSSLRKAKFPFNCLSKFMIVPGLKFELQSLLSVSKIKRSIFFVSGITISYSIFTLNLLVLIFLTNLSVLPLIIVGLFIIIFYSFVLYSSWNWYGDLYKAKNVYHLKKNLEFY